MSRDTICIWRGRALFLGQLPAAEPHLHSAAAVCVGLESALRVQEDDEWRECRSALIPHNVWHNLVCDGPCAVLFMDPDASGYEKLSESNGALAGCSFDIRQTEALQSIFKSIQNDDSAISDALARIDRVTFRSPETGQFPQDERLRRVIEYMLETNLESNPPVEELCSISDLSESRLQHLFKETLGISIRKFRIWFRLKAAAILLKEGSDFTQAALGAGFYDAAHLSHCFRDTFGFAPSAIFKGQREVRWHIQDELETKQLLNLSR
ncbi:MAG: AraC family transcriptional regulator [Spirochaetia bacterium]|nr:AraC family transcriptional regulator [Spirochaetia bacterium]